jgi:UTP-glucose-1-phosphate uridylyltransferase
MGVYIFSPKIFDAIKKTKPGVKDEYQLTDSIKIMVDEGYKVLYSKINGEHIDVGTLEDLRKANLRFSSKK